MGREKQTQPGLGSAIGDSRSTDADSTSADSIEAPVASGRLPQDRTRTEPDERRPTASGKKRKVATQRGLSDSKPPKVVTKHGLAPPPTTSTPPPPDPDQEIYDPPIPSSSRVPSIDWSEAEGWVPDHAALEAARDELTPTEPEMAPDEDEDSGEPSIRSQFQTSRGGGKNRVSGGRAAASAYVSPSTVAPGHGDDHHTAAVKLHESVRAEAYAFHTEPSLLRRRQSSVPAELAGLPKRRINMAWVLLFSLLGGFLTGAFALWWDRKGVESRAPDAAGTIAENSRNGLAQRPNEPSGTPTGTLPERSPGSATAPPDSAEPRPQDTHPTQLNIDSPAATAKAADTESPPKATPPSPRPSSTTRSSPGDPRPAPRSTAPSQSDPSSELWLE